MNHCLFKAKDTKGAVGNTVDYSSLTKYRDISIAFIKNTKWTSQHKLENAKKREGTQDIYTDQDKRQYELKRTIQGGDLF